MDCCQINGQEIETMLNSFGTLVTGCASISVAWFNLYCNSYNATNTCDKTGYNVYDRMGFGASIFGVSIVLMAFALQAIRLCFEKINKIKKYNKYEFCIKTGIFLLLFIGAGLSLLAFTQVEPWGFNSSNIGSPPD